MGVSYTVQARTTPGLYLLGRHTEDVQPPVPTGVVLVVVVAVKKIML